MRNAVLVLLGLVIGAFATLNIVHALRQRDAYPRGLMNVLQYHAAALHDDVRARRCTDASLRHLDVLRELSTDIGPAVYGASTPDAPFREYQQRLQDALGVRSCAELAANPDRIGAACDACHRQYR